MSKSKRKYHRGERITSIDEMLKEQIAYLGAYDYRPKPVSVLKCMTLNTLLGYMEGPGIYQAVFGEGPDETSGPTEQIDGQINFLEGDVDEGSKSALSV